MPWTKIPLDNETLGDCPPGAHVATYAEALREAQAQLLEASPDVFLIGEGIDDVGGVFGSTLGLHTRFPGRVLDSPISENAVTGACAGAAMSGMRPILIHMRGDFLLMSMDQIVNHAAKWRYLENGQVSVPLVIRSMIGRGWGSGAQHSQGLHGLFMHIPGLKIAVPATPYDAKGLLMQASADGNPVLFFEHRWLYALKGHVPDVPYTIPFGTGVIRRKGTDATVVAVLQMVKEACLAAEALSRQGIELEVIDPRTLCPLDMESILCSVEKTGRLLVADNAHGVCGLGAEIIARVAEHGIKFKAPPARINFPFVPTPASPALEDAYYPSARHIEQAAKVMLKAHDE
jgi:pyruvate dehydrogenase E1 component beta subunit